MVELLVELVQLSSLGHHVLLHHERRLDLLVSSLPQELQAVVDQGLVQVETIVGQEETSVAGDLGASFGVKGVESGEDLVVRNDVGGDVRFAQTLLFHVHALVVGTFGVPQLGDGVLVLSRCNGRQLVP